MTIEEILNKLHNKEALTEEERTQLSDALKGAVSGQKVDGKALTIEEQGTLLKSADVLRNTPEMQSLFKEIAQDKQADKFSKRYKPFFNLLMSGADIATSLKQIRASDKALASLHKPILTSAPGLDPALKNEIYKAQQGNFEAERALSPVRQEIRDQYAKDLNTARIVSGGQAGAYGAYAQAASNARLRAAGQLPGISDQIRRSQQARLDNLIGMRQSQANANFSQNLQRDQINLEQYNRQAQAAGQLGATGRLNLRNSLATGADNLLDVTGRLMPVANPYANSSAQYEPQASSSEPYAEYRNMVEQSLANKISGIQNPYRNGYFDVRANKINPSDYIY